MNDATASAIERAKAMLTDAETFHLPSAPLPLGLLRELIQIAERGPRLESDAL